MSTSHAGIPPGYAAPSLGAVLERGIPLGAAAGALVGMLAGTALGVGGTPMWAILGAGGAYAGAAVGAGIGLAASALLSATLRLRRSSAPPRPSVTRLLLGVDSAAVVALGGVAAAGSTGPPAVSMWALFAVITLSGAIGAAAGPLVVFGPRPTPLIARSIRIVKTGVLAGAVCGGVAGATIGVVVYAPTAPVAAAEGAFFGSGAGGSLAIAVAAAVVLPGLRAARPGHSTQRPQPMPPAPPTP